MWLISPQLRQPSFNLVSSSCKIEADKPRHWALVWISESTEEFNVIQSLPSRLTPKSLQVSVQAEQQAVARGSLGSVKQISHSQTPRVLSQQRSQQFLPSSSHSSPARASTGVRHGPYLCPPTPLPTLAAPAPKVPAGGPQAAVAGTMSCRVAPARAAPPAQGGPRLPVGHLAHHRALGSHRVSSGVA